MIGFAMNLERYIAVRKDVPKDNASARFLRYALMPSSGLLRSVEKIVGGIGNTDFLARVCRVAAGCGGFASFGVEALNAGGAGKYAAAFMTHDVDKKPGNGIGIRRRHIGNGFAGDTAAVICLPGWSGKMFTEGFAVFIEELGVGSFQPPREFRGTSLADVDLISLRVNLDK